jgi:O-acetyl-ADP-ribose deacetylase (regulator of RNase III)
MTFLKHTSGNLLDLAEQGNFNVIVHGANCFNTMGSGIAKEIRERYPRAYEVDCTTTAGDYNKLGNYTVMLGKQFNIVNAYTQYDFNRRGESEDVFEYVSFAMILQKLAKKYPTCKFGFPYIGSGLAGGNKEIITSLLEDFALKLSETGGEATLVAFK